MVRIGHVPGHRRAEAAARMVCGACAWRMQTTPGPFSVHFAFPLVGWNRCGRTGRGSGSGNIRSGRSSSSIVVGLYR